MEEMQLMETRHHHEIKVLKSQCSALQQKISMQEKAQEELTNKMREHLSAQLNEMNRIAPSSGILIGKHHILRNMPSMS